MKRQGLTTSIFELRCLADELEAQCEFANCGKGINFQLNIINKLGLSDEWKFEKSPKP